ncbi:MAG: FIVAR domain-containing protein [Bifidobacterium sp.]|nr:FIVAR domain-containing protein [Bifidobacterium sp.]
MNGSHIRIRMRNYITNQWVNEGKYDFNLDDTDPTYRVKDISPSAYIATDGSHDDAYDPDNRNGRLQYIDDSDRQSNWRSQDLGDVSQAWVDFAFSKPTRISGVTYLPYLGGYFETGPHTGWYDTSEGTMLDYRIEVSHDNGATYQTAATGTLKTGMKESWMPIPTQTVSNVRVVPLSTYGMPTTRSARGFVAAAEMHPAVMAQSTVTLKYQDAQGNTLKTDDSETGDVGAPYSFTAPAIDGYSCTKRFDGTYTDNDQTLVFVYSPNSDKTALRDAVQQAQAIDLSPYTPASTDRFRSALTGAVNVLNDPGATQQDVKQAADSLQKAVAGLVVKGDKTRLDALIEQVQKIEGSQYTPQSFAALRQALQNAIGALNGANADQSMVDNALRELSDAQQKLEKLTIQKPSLPAKPLPGTIADGTTPIINDSQSNDTTHSTTTGEENHGLASTGASIAIPLLAAIILLIAGGTLALLKRKKH